MRVVIFHGKQHTAKHTMYLKRESSSRSTYTVAENFPKKVTLAVPCSIFFPVLARSLFRSNNLPPYATYGRRSVVLHDGNLSSMWKTPLRWHEPRHVRDIGCKQATKQASAISQQYFTLQRTAQKKSVRPAAHNRPTDVARIFGCRLGK